MSGDHSMCSAVRAALRRQQEAMQGKTDHYLLDTCGADGVYLANGFKRIIRNGRDCVVFENLDGLMVAIGKEICKSPFVTGNEVRFLRTALRMSQSQLADILGVSENMVSLWERKSRIPKLSLAAIKALYLDCNGLPYRFRDLLMLDESKRFERMTFSFNGNVWRLVEERVWPV